MNIKEPISCLSLSEIREEGMNILDRESDEIKLIKQPPGKGKTSLVEAYIAKTFRENKREVIIITTDKNLLALDSYRASKDAGIFEDYLVLLNSQSASEKGTLGYDISRPDTQYGGNVYFNKIKNSIYEGPIAIFTTPAYICTTYPSYFFRSALSYCITSGIQLKIIMDETDALKKKSNKLLLFFFFTILEKS